MIAALIALLCRPLVLLDHPAAPGAPTPARCYCGHPPHHHRDGDSWCDHCTCSYYQPMPTI